MSGQALSKQKLAEQITIEQVRIEDGTEQPSGTEVVYIGNMPYFISEREIRKIFRPYAPIHAVILIEDKRGRPRGFGFIVLDEQKADLAIKDLNQKIYGSRVLRISKATGIVSRRRSRCVDARGN